MGKNNYTFEQFSSTRLYTGLVAYSPDGKDILHCHNATGQFNLWRIPSGGGLMYQLTSYADNTIRNAIWSTDGEKIYYQADQNGDEQHQIYAISALGGKATALTTKMDSQHNLSDISPDGKHLLYSANDANPMHVDVLIRDLETGDIERVIKERQTFPASFSRDGKYLTAIDFMGNTNQDILLVNRETGDIVNTTEHEGETVYFAGPWSPDSSGFYVFTNKGREFNNIAYYDIASGELDWKLTPEHDFEDIKISKNGKVMIWRLNVDGASKLFGRNLETGDDLELPDLPLGVVGGMDINPDGTRLALVFASPKETSNLFEFNLETGEMLRLGQSMLGGIDVEDLVEPDLVEYETFDGRKIPAWLYKPEGPEGMRYPVVLSIHGGPEAQERPTYNYDGLYQYLLSRGFGILAPNIRGSTGYGITYQKLIHRDWGGAELKDIEHAAKYLQALDWVDSNRIAVYGGSFGGFATLSAVTRLPEYWAVGVDLVGPSNLVTFASSVPEFWKPIMRKWVGDPEDDYEMLMERSPITYVDDIKAPLLVIQGAKDPRVVKAESDQMVERIRKNGGDVVYYVDEEEGHGATRRENRFKWFRMITEYLEERLLDEPVLN